MKENSSYNFQHTYFRSLKALSIIAVICIAIVAGTDFLSAAVGVGQIINPELSFTTQDGGQMSIWLGVQGLIAIFELLALIGSAIFFLVWLNRAHKNLTALHPQHLEFSSGWAVGWWFVPFANLVKPFQVVREVWWESDPDRSDDHQFLSTSLHSAPSYMGFWWAAWIAMNVLANLTSKTYDVDKNQGIEVSGYLFILTGIVSVVAAGLAIYLVFDITLRQNVRFQNLNISRSHFPPDTLS